MPAVAQYLSYLLFAYIVYRAVNGFFIRTFRQAEAIDSRTRMLEIKLEEACFNIEANVNECIDLRKRVNYSEEKMDEYARVLEALSIPMESPGSESTSEKLSVKSRNTSGAGLQGMGTVMPAPGSVAKAEISPGPQYQQHQQHYILKSLDGAKERAERRTSSSESTSSAIDRLAGLRGKFESGRESVMSALSNIPVRRRVVIKPGGVSKNSISNFAASRPFGKLRRSSLKLDK
ncbi:hypothetical protein LOZ56_005918 [Ophidiomyces ophidiicola]|nr:hypothetical protein LOZ56_005918 [Ophidiomyces ophidiicola]